MAARIEEDCLARRHARTYLNAAALQGQAARPAAPGTDSPRASKHAARTELVPTSSAITSMCVIFNYGARKHVPISEAGGLHGKGREDS